MKLYDYFRSSAAYRVRIALNLKGLEAERTFVHLRRKEQTAKAYLQVNPQGLVPALVDGAHGLTQSLAIIEYLDEIHPEPPLLPQDPAGRARVRAIGLAIACDIHPINNLRVLNYLSSTLGLSKAQKNDWYRHWVAEGLAGVEGLLASGAGGGFCHGDAPGLADICLVPQVFNAERFGCDLASYPNVRRIAAACRDLPAFAAAAPDRQPDAE